MLKEWFLLLLLKAKSLQLVNTFESFYPLYNTCSCSLCGVLKKDLTSCMPHTVTCPFTEILLTHLCYPLKSIFFSKRNGIPLLYSRIFWMSMLVLGILFFIVFLGHPATGKPLLCSMIFWVSMLVLGIYSSLISLFIPPLQYTCFYVLFFVVCSSFMRNFTNCGRLMYNTWIFLFLRMSCFEKLIFCDTKNHAKTQETSTLYPGNSKVTFHR